MLRDPQTLAVFTAVAPQRELATNAELTGSYDRAKHALRSVAGDLSAKLGPTLVTGQAVLDWITASSGAARPVALELGRALMRTGRLRHVYDDRPMQDGRELYRLH